MSERGSVGPSRHPTSLRPANTAINVGNSAAIPLAIEKVGPLADRIFKGPLYTQGQARCRLQRRNRDPELMLRQYAHMMPQEETDLSFRALAAPDGRMRPQTAVCGPRLLIHHPPIL